MSVESGVSIEDVQQAICIGKEYGGKEWSDTERQEACQRYEEITGVKLNVSTHNNQAIDYLAILIILAFVLFASILAYLYRHKSIKIRMKK